MTLIYGSRSWVDHCPGAMIQQMRPTSYVDVQVPFCTLEMNNYASIRSLVLLVLCFYILQIIQGAGHHVYADKREKFNELVLKAAALGDENNTTRYTQSSSENSESRKTIDEHEIQVDVKDSTTSHKTNKST